MLYITKYQTKQQTDDNLFTNWSQYSFSGSMKSLHYYRVHVVSALLRKIWHMQFSLCQFRQSVVKVHVLLFH